MSNGTSSSPPTVGDTTCALFRIADLAAGDTDTLPVTDIMLHNVAQIVPQDAAVVLEKHGDRLVVAGVSGGGLAAQATGVALPKEVEGLLLAVIERGRLAAFGAEARHPSAIHSLLGWRPGAEAILPIRTAGVGLGALVLGRKTGPPFAWEDEKVLVPLAAVVGRLLQSVKLCADMREHSRHLAEEHKRVVEAVRLQRDFISNVSHELRTPLTGILGFAELLQDEDIGSEPETRREFLGMIHESGQNLLRLINRILDFGKLQAGRRDPTFDQVDLVAIARRSVAALSGRAQQRKLQVDVWAEGEIPQVWASARFCDEIVTNLVGNAIKFTDKGWVRVMVRGVNARLGNEETGSAVELRVADSGPGIPHEQQQRIFEPFRQADGSRSRRHGGTGLGLALCREMVESVGGRIWVESRPGDGATFVVLLPAVTGRERRMLTLSEPELRRPTGVSSALPAATPVPWGQEASPVVLVALGDKDEAERIEQVLKTAGYRVRRADSGNEVLSAANRLLPAAIVCDLYLDEMNAWQVLGSLRATAATRSTAMVVASPFTSHTGQTFFDGHGHGVELPSPLDPEGLLAWLCGLLEGRERPPARLLVVGFGGEFLTALDRESSTGEVSAVRCDTAADAARQLQCGQPDLLAWRPTDTDPTESVLAQALVELGERAPPVSLVAAVVPPGLLAVTALPGTGVWKPSSATPVALFREVGRLRHVRPTPHVLSGDPLTGLPGRDYMERRLAEEHHRALRYGRPFSALTFVLEDPADGKGVPVAVQRAAANALRQQLRESDVLARVAPGTFVALLTETSADHAQLARVRLARLYPTGEVLGYKYHSFPWPPGGMEITATVCLDDVVRPPLTE